MSTLKEEITRYCFKRRVIPWSRKIPIAKNAKEQKTAKEQKERIPTKEQASDESKWGGGEEAESEEGDQETCSEAILDQPAV